jgi:endonuclease YncB( thermonuclease family)
LDTNLIKKLIKKVDNITLKILYIYIMDKITRFFNCFSNNNNKIIDDLKNIKSSDISQFSLNGMKTRGKVVEIYDGDTCKIVLLNNNVLQKFNCRMNGIDTPEIKPLLSNPNREIEIKNAYKARNRLIQLCTNANIDFKNFDTKKVSLDTNTKLVYIKCLEFDKYGRLLVNIYDNENSISYNEILINEGFAKKYDGGTKNAFTY